MLSRLRTEYLPRRSLMEEYKEIIDIDKILGWDIEKASVAYVFVAMTTLDPNSTIEYNNLVRYVKSHAVDRRYIYLDDTESILKQLLKKENIQDNNVKGIKCTARSIEDSDSESEESPEQRERNLRSTRSPGPGEILLTKAILTRHSYSIEEADLRERLTRQPPEPEVVLTKSKAVMRARRILGLESPCHETEMA